ncbi:hypothetical protein [Vibrio vulnificus]|uniref:hypothetical protein n=1 Tax=Vibrio vulnificus TaxID=672 RepID=UPI001A2555A8|nr:hypothetical protein [Vibrio vulnificus]MBY7811698.1 hypothetical protein [Vibrio fluvialis]MCG8706660.1 hypothetical protein [Vibrio vulnificus]HAS8156259.1 hypothetical protein [Vibrio vulnificus]
MSVGNFAKSVSNNATLIVESQSLGLRWWSENTGYKGKTQTDVINELQQWPQDPDIRKTTQYRNDMDRLLNAADLKITIS